MTEMIPTPEVNAGPRVLLVDDEPNVLKALRRSLAGRGFEVSMASCGAEALALLAREPVDAIVCDMRMPGMDGTEVLKRSLELAPNAVRVLLTGYADIASTVKAVNEGEIFRYLAKPWDDAFLLQVLRDGLARRALERERDALLVITEQQNDSLRRLSAALEDKVEQRTLELRATVAELQRLSDRLKNDLSCTVRMLSSLIEPRAGLTARCPSLVARRVRTLGAALGLRGEALHDLNCAALLQDIGKLALPDALTRQPLEALQLEEREQLLRHTLIGECSLMALPSLKGAAAIIGQVNANVDGSGSPAGLRGEDILLGARILRVASDFEHYLAGAIELGPLTREQAFRRIRQQRGTRYDARVVDEFLQSMDQPVARPARRMLMSSANLRAGMRLAQDLVSATGSLLVPQGCSLDDGTIVQLRRVEALSGEFLWVAVNEDGREALAA
jgi:response regulator RpfG family c-di-GMP phosphodiesterase